MLNKSLTTVYQFPGNKTSGDALPQRVTEIGDYAFEGCLGLTNITLPRSLTRIERYGFASCKNLTRVTIPAGVGYLGDRAFVACFSLTEVYCGGDAPTLGSTYVFYNANDARIYYLPEATGWPSSYGGRPTVLWNPQVDTTVPTFGPQATGFGLPVTGTANLPIVLEASTDPTGSGWTSLLSGSLTNGSLHFTDAEWTDYSVRYYRFRSP